MTKLTDEVDNYLKKDILDTEKIARYELKLLADICRQLEQIKIVLNKNFNGGF